MKKRQLIAAFLAVFLLASLLPSARAEGGLILHWVQTGQTRASVSVEGINGAQGVFAAQLELELDGAYPDARLTLPAGRQSTVYQAEPTVKVSEGKTNLTFYFYSDSPINDDGPFSLGSIDLAGEFVQPASAKLTLLDWSLAPLANADRTKVSISSELAFLPFQDVSETDWFYDAVRYVYGAGIMNGTQVHIFSPNRVTSRGMIVTILHRLEGTPTTPPHRFDDVAEGQWYTEAVDWAAANGIVLGYVNGNFGPNDPITREQLATILYRYAKYKELDMGKPGSLDTFPDRAQVSSFAQEPMAWAVGAGLIKGMDTGELAPGRSSTRAQVATIFQRFADLIED